MRTGNMENQDFFSKVIDGDLGLAVTFWVVWPSQGLLCYALTQTGLASTTDMWIFFAVFYLSYVVVVQGVWKAATKYQGPPIWSGLAKGVVVISVIGHLAIIAVILIAIKGAAT